MPIASAKSRTAGFRANLGVVCIAVLVGAGGCSNTGAEKEIDPWSFCSGSADATEPSSAPTATADCGDRTIPLGNPPCSEGLDRARSCELATVASPRLVASTPRPARNLEQLALQLTDRAVAPRDLYARVVLDVEAIREDHPSLSDSAQYNSSRAAKVGGNAVLELQTTHEFARMVHEGRSPSGLSCLNRYYGTRRTRARNWDDAEKIPYVLIVTEGVYDMTQVAADYGRLDGVEGARPAQVKRTGHEVTRYLCAERSDDGIRYVVQHRDSGMNTTTSRHLFFSSAPGCVEKRDEHIKDSDAPRPEWWAICEKTYEYE